jgi:hypothetical protein
MSHISSIPRELVLVSLHESTETKILNFLPSAIRSQIQGIISSSSQSDQSEVICRNAATWIRALSKDTQAKIYGEFYKACGVRSTGNPRWGEDNISDPSKADNLLQVFEKVFRIPFSSLVFGADTLKYLDKDSFLNLSTCSRQLREELKQIYYISHRLITSEWRLPTRYDSLEYLSPEAFSHRIKHMDRIKNASLSEAFKILKTDNQVDMFIKYHL